MKAVFLTKEYNDTDIEEQKNILEQSFHTFFDEIHRSPVLIVSNFASGHIVMPLEIALFENNISYGNWESEPCDYDGLNQVIIQNSIKHIFCDRHVDVNLINTDNVKVYRI
jgi:hypothetical protein